MDIVTVCETQLWGWFVAPEKELVPDGKLLFIDEKVNSIEEYIMTSKFVGL